jgi:sortase A
MKKGIILVIVGCFLIILSGLMVTYNHYEDKNAMIESRKVYDIIHNEELSIYEEPEDLFENKEMKSLNIDGYDYIATINIPALNLELPVMSDWDYKRMKISPCRYYGSIFTNDLVIAAHNFDNVFGRIKYLNEGDLLILTDMNNDEYIYKVEVVEILEANDVKEMIESEFDLTLYTCTKGGLSRVTVRLNRV